MTTTNLIETTIGELLEHVARLEALRHEPFNTGRIDIHRNEALECLDVIAARINGEPVNA